VRDQAEAALASADPEQAATLRGMCAALEAVIEFGRRLADLADRWLIAGVVVRGTHGSIELTGRLLRLVQTGNLQTYAFLFVAGVAVLLLCLLGR